MRGSPIFIIVFIVILLAIDVYSYWGITKITKDLRASIKRAIKILFWIVPVIIIIGLALLLSFQPHIPPSQFFIYFHFISGAFILFYVPKLIFVVFNLFDDVIFQIRKRISLIKNRSKETKSAGKLITRRKFLNQVGIVFAGIPFASLLYGIAHGRFDFTFRNVKLKFPHLPENFRGLRIIQISDFHIGTFINNSDKVQEIVKLINNQNPDILLFTGDLVNNLSSEVDPFISDLGNLKAGIGKYSILGNHDYGEYVRWKSDEKKRKNLERLILLQREMGFDLLLDESRRINIEDQFIELIGVQNWGLPPFPQYGDLKKAMKNVDETAVKILLSHDPTHWDEQVLNKTTIDLTLSGHTHGAQFGIEIPGWRWSPASIRYKRWGGLYTEGKQHLYINTGLGSIAYPGRVGMPPEITVFELCQSI
ncbi:MAG: metallophosphoesterase [Bacteroidota bacterium]